MQGLRGCRVMHWWSGHKQAELERGLVRMLYRQPTIVAVSNVGVDEKPQLFDVKRKRFVLITHIQTDHIDALSHITSLDWSCSVPGACIRRFSETAIFRFGRCASRMTHSGMCSPTCGA